MPSPKCLLVLQVIVILLQQKCGVSQEISGPQPVDLRHVPEVVVREAVDDFERRAREQLEEANKEAGHSTWLTAPRLVSAKEQAIQGKLFYLTLVVGESSCDYSTPILDCGTGQLHLSSPSEATYQCEMQIWYRTWMQPPKDLEPQDFSCNEV
ncbi:uncharacterized protein [Diadema antillarum]|uniref:uncharacterized protein n=1 Tax=Diadema antillarum TaxID=105358 RepID=UPI003A8910B9